MSENKNFVKIKSDLPHRRGVTINTSKCEVTFDEKCEAEVEEEVAFKLVSLDIGISIVKEDLQSSDKIDKEILEEDKTKEEEEEKLKEQKEVLLALSKKTIVELHELAESFSLPKEEWKNLKKNELVVYLSKK